MVWRFPLALWLLGLGPIIGRLFLVITVTGRKSGLPRRAVVEYHQLNGKKYIASGFGSESQWYKNLLADPLVTVQSSEGLESMWAVRVTDDDELLAVIDLFSRADTPAFVNWYLRSFDIEPDEADILAKKERLQIIRLEPTNERTPPGLEVDLAWAWPAAILMLWALRFLPGRRGRRG
jgi:deazaflavin-dependent oxidoreductase (nitroreductase family)